MSKAYVEVPGTIWLVIIMGAAQGWLSPNPALTSASLLILPLLVFSLWLKEAPPVLSFLLFFQWLEVTLKLFNFDFIGESVRGMIRVGTEENPLFIYSTEINKALWLALGGLLSLTAGMRLGIAGMAKGHEKKILFEKSETLPVRKLFILYVAFSVISIPLIHLGWRFESLLQILIALTNVKWVIFFLLAYSVLERKKEYGFLIVTFLLEISTGFLSYFAQFKNIFFITAVVFLTINYRFKAKHILVAMAFFLLALLLGSAWSIIKKDYRLFLDEAQIRQSSPSLLARAEKMSGLIAGLNHQRLKKGAELLTERIAYVDYFAQVLQMVPRWVPHEDGQLWKGALRHVMTPRILFSDKASLASDSDITRKYTGIRVAGGEMGGGTSIGIGYFAESYVDFGVPLMFLPLFLMGFLQGFAYRRLIGKAKTRVFGYAVATAALLFSGVSIATSSAKVLGGTVMNFVILAIFSRLFERKFTRHIVITP